MWMLKSIKCIECNKGGDLLSCHGNHCPIAVHEQCVALPIRFDENGKFYCPYCSYNRELRGELVLREKVNLAKQALLKFINFRVDGGAENGEGVSILGDASRSNGDCDGNGGKGKTGKESSRGKCSEGLCGGDADGVAGEKCVQVVDGEKVVENDPSDEVVVVPLVVGEKDDGLCSQEKRKGDDDLNVNDDDGKNCDKDDSEVDRIENNIADNEKDDCCSQEERIKDIDFSVNEDEDETLEEEDRGQVDKREIDERIVEGDKQVETDVLLAQKDGSPKVDEISCDSDSTLLAERHRQSDHRSKYALRRRHVSPGILSPHRKISKEKSNQEKEVSQSKRPRESQKSPLKFKNLKFPPEKRKRLSWKPEEEEMLKEGVQKFSSNAYKNIPWRNILVFGRHVFDSSRTPTDLKDKWKNIMAKGF